MNSIINNIMNIKRMNKKLFYRTLAGLLFVFGTQNMQAQDCNPKFEIVVEGSSCASGGKAEVTINVTADDSEIDISNNTFVVSANQAYVTSSVLGGNVVYLAPGNYTLYATGIKCNGNSITPGYVSFSVTLGLKVPEAGYRRCSASDIYVSTKVSGGVGPYTYQLIADGNVIDTKSDPSSEISFYATTSSSDLKIKVIDVGCTKNTPVTQTLTKTSDLSAITSVIEGDKEVCLNGTVELSVQSIYSGSNFKWKKGNTVISTSNTLKIENVSDNDSGAYSFSMVFDGCNNEFTENFNIAVGNAPEPNVSPAFPCLNSTSVSLSNYVSVTSNSYTLVWYNADGSLVGATAPVFTPNNTGTFKYLVSQKSSGGCESQKAELTLVVEELPLAIGANNIIFCNDPSNPDPQMIVINAGNYTYNLYENYSGGVKIGSGTASNDTAYISSQNLVIGRDYYLQTENTHGCVSQGRTTIRVTVKESLILGTNKICLGDNLSLTADYPGGKIVWTKPDNSTYEGKVLSVNNITFADAGVYHLLIEESGLGCTMRDEIYVAVTQPVPPVVEIESFRYFENQTASPMTATPKEGLTLKWYNPDNELISGQSPVPATNHTGVFVYHVSQDSAGCESPKVDVTVIVGTIPPAVSASDINICIADKPVIQIANTTLDYTYNVYYQNSVIAGGVGTGEAISLTSNVSVPENAEFEITVSDIYGVSSARTKKDVIAVGSLIAQSFPVLCYSSDADLKALVINDASYTWTRPDGSTNSLSIISITDAKFEDTGEYILAVTTSGCPVVTTKTHVKVTQPELPVVEKDSYRFYENENATAMTATPKEGLTLKWYNPDDELIPGQSPIPATNVVGTFVYHVSQDSAGCESPKVAVTVIVGNIPSSVPASDVNVCIADKPVVQIQNTTQDYKYIVYNKTDKIAEGVGNGGAITLTSNVSVSENTELEIAVFDTYNVSSARTAKVLISINNLIDAQASSSSVCDGSNGKLVAVAITDATYVWTTPIGIFNEQFVNVSDASIDDAGIYTLAVTTPGCPVAKQSVNLKVEKPANPVTEKEIYYCVGDNATQLTATPLTGYKLVWFNELSEQLPDAPTPNTSELGTAVYYVAQVSLSDANCSSDKEEITVSVEDKPESVNLAPVNICAIQDNDENQVSISVPNSLEGYIYGLYTQENDGALVGQVISASDGSLANIIVENGIPSNITYYLQVTNKAGCVSARTPVEITLIEITLSPNELAPYKVEEFYSQRLETNATNPAFSIIKGYLPAGFTLSAVGDISGIATSYSEPERLTIEVTNELGCSIQKEYTLKSELIVAKMFSPNGDGINDVFMKGYKVVVFDRLGRKLFDGENGWDGTFNGKTLPEDVYYYILYYKDKEGKEKHITGYTTLIKTY
jgi:gliding motility-associated-like protein